MKTFRDEVCDARKAVLSFGFRRWGGKFSDTEIEDLVQDTVAAALKGEATFRREATVTSWMIEIFKLKVISHLRSRRNVVPFHELFEGDKEEDEAEFEFELRVEPTQEAEYLAARESALLHRALEQLSEEHRTVVSLFYFKAWPTPKIGAFLGVPVSTVKTRMFHARKRLRAQLHRQLA